jgi:hypothetical protein
MPKNSCGIVKKGISLMMMINENKFNRLWTISKYVYGLYPIIVTIFSIPSLLPAYQITVGFVAFFSSYPLIATMIIVNALLGILILTRSPRLGAYLIAALGTIGVLINFSRSVESSDFIFIFAYIAFGLLTEIKETARKQQ